ncbi:MAG: PEGA domain-containing protein [Methanomicrobiales archaeon]|nr:PEGA domain-containing protein [Methanomicrobiales archaeon]
MSLSMPVSSRCLVAAILALALLAGAASAQSIGGDVGYYAVSSVPSGADVHFDGQYQGTTPLTIQVYTTAPPGHTISVTMSGYKTWTQSLSGNPAAGETISLNAVLEPIVVYGWLTVTSSPSGATIYLNGNYRGVTPNTITDLQPGTYTVRAELQGYNPQQVTTSVVAGQETTQHFSLQKIVQTGSITFLSTPSGAYIYLDGVYRGRTPLTVTDVSAGTHGITLEATGYYDWKTTTTVGEGSSQTISATLTPTSSMGWISVSSRPTGATVYLDGVVKGQTPSQGSLTLEAPAGDHTLKLTLSGYQDYTTGVNVRMDTTSTISATLTSTSIASTGTLSVASSPSPANVYVDNAFKGVTPVTLTGIQAGIRTVKIQLGGYNDWTMDVQVVSGMTTPVNAVLVPQATQTPTPTPTQSGAVPLLVPGALALLVLCLGLRRKE